MSVFSLGRISLNLIFPILMLIFSFSSYYIRNNYLIFNSTNTSIKIKNSDSYKIEFLFFYALESISCLLCGIMFLFQYKQKISKSAVNVYDYDNDNDNDDNLIQKITPKQKKYKNKKYSLSFKYLLFLGFLKFGGTISYALSYVFSQNFQVNIFTIFGIITTTIIARIVLGTKSKKHTRISIIIILIGILMAGFHTTLHNKEIFSWFLIICLLISMLLFSFLEVFEKQQMDFYYVNPYNILFKEGIVTFILQSICLLIVHNQVTIIENGNEILFFKFIYNHFNKKRFALCVIFVFLIMVHEVGRINTNRYFSPTHRVIIDSTTSLAIWLTRMMHNYWEFTYINVIEAVGYVIMIVGCLIYHEIIILRICEMDQNTEEEIVKRANDEMIGSLFDETKFSGSEVVY